MSGTAGDAWQAVSEAGLRICTTTHGAAPIERVTAERSAEAMHAARCVQDQEGAREGAEGMKPEALATTADTAATRIVAAATQLSALLYASRMS